MKFTINRHHRRLVKRDLIPWCYPFRRVTAAGAAHNGIGFSWLLWRGTITR